MPGQPTHLRGAGHSVNQTGQGTLGAWGITPATSLQADALRLRRSKGSPFFFTPPLAGHLHSRADATTHGLGIRETLTAMRLRLTSLKLNSLRDLLIQELRDLYSAEAQLTKALPKMADTASTAQLRQAFEEHQRQTQEHVNRLERIFDRLHEDPSGESCEAMKGLVSEGQLYVEAEGEAEVRDAGLIGAAQRIEHYEIAGYGTARSLARRLGENAIADLLQETLDEESHTDKRLTSIAESYVNVEAATR